MSIHDSFLLTFNIFIRAATIKQRQLIHLIVPATVAQISHSGTTYSVTIAINSININPVQETLGVRPLHPKYLEQDLFNLITFKRFMISAQCT